MMELSRESFWQVLRHVFSDNRFRLGLFSVFGWYLVKPIVCKSWARRQSKKKFEARRRQAEALKAVTLRQSQKAKELSLAKRSLEDLVTAVKSGDVSAHELLMAMTKQALTIDDGLNAVTEPIPEAVEQAKRCDSSSDKSGLLFGIPISVKENIGLKGHDATAGFGSRINVNLNEDAVIVKVLKKQGAIPFVRTNVAQYILSYSSTNTLYGRTVNPHDKSRSPGGSSSGEASLIGAGGSIIGIGSDVGGSVRVPADFCGIYSLKTTVGRISGKGIVTAGKGRLAIQGTMGPMARDFDSLLLLTKAILSEEMYALDPTIPVMPFNEPVYSRTEPLRIGYFTYNGDIRCQPPVIRAVMEARDALQSRGHELLEIDFPEVFKPGFMSGANFYRILLADSCERLKRAAGDDELTEIISNKFADFRRPVCYWKFLSKLVTEFEKDCISGMYGFRSIGEYWDHVSSFMEWQDNFLSVWMDLKIDALICPVFPCPAVKLELDPIITLCGIYSQLFNALNYPSGTVPVTKVTKEDVQQTLNSEFKPTNSMEKLMQKNVEGMEGLPVGVQCVALPFREEMCLRVMRDLDAHLKQGTVI